MQKARRIIFSLFAYNNFLFAVNYISILSNLVCYSVLSTTP